MICSQGCAARVLRNPWAESRQNAALHQNNQASWWAVGVPPSQVQLAEINVGCLPPINHESKLPRRGGDMKYPSGTVAPAQRSYPCDAEKCAAEASPHLTPDRMKPSPPHVEGRAVRGAVYGHGPFSDQKCPEMIPCKRTARRSSFLDCNVASTTKHTSGNAYEI